MAVPNELSLDASSPVKVPRCRRPSHPHRKPKRVIHCHCGVPADFIVDPPVPDMRRSICHERKCDHDVWMKRSLTNTKKAIAISTLRASVNKLKGTLLEKCVALRELNQVNLGLRLELHKSDRATMVWISTAGLLTIMLAFIASVYML